MDRLDRAADVNEAYREVRIADGVVERPATPGTATVHSLLRHLRDQGLDCVPEPIGVVDGIESLRFVEGADSGEGWYHQHTDAGLSSAARLLRRIHDASADWVPPPDAVWGAPAVPWLSKCGVSSGKFPVLWKERTSRNMAPALTC